MAVREIYILQKQYVDRGHVMYDHKPICGSEDYDTIVKYAKALRDYILEYNDDWFDVLDDDPWVESSPKEPLVAWDGFNYYAVGVNDQSIRIVFRISTIPILKIDISQKEQLAEIPID